MKPRSPETTAPSTCHFSHGCVRLAPEAAEWLYRLVQQLGARNTTIRVE